MKHWSLGLIFCWLSMFASSLPGQETPSATGDFIRFERLAPARAELQTSIRRYRHPSTGQVVSLVGAVHIAEPEYFHAIQDDLDRHELVLFELVGDPGTRPSPQTRQRMSAISQLQTAMQDVLELAHQMDSIDYGRKNFRHADLNSAQFSRALREKGLFNFSAKGILEAIGPAYLQGLGMQAAMRGADDQMVNRLRWQMARVMSNLDVQMGMLGVDDIENPDDLIIGIRNDQVWKVLKQASPEGHRRIAIFYGAAHLPDLQRRLLADGWLLEETIWLGAWHIPKQEEDERSSSESKPAALREARL